MFFLALLALLNGAGTGGLQSESPIRMRPLTLARLATPEDPLSHVTLHATAEHPLLVEGDGYLELAVVLASEAGDRGSLTLELSPPEGMSTVRVSEQTDSDGARAFAYSVTGWPLGAVLEARIHYVSCDETDTCGPATEAFEVLRVLDDSRDSDPRAELSRREGRNGPTGMTRRLMELDTDGDGRLSLSEIPEHMEATRESFDRLDRNGDGFVDARELEEMTRPDFRRRR